VDRGGTAWVLFSDGNLYHVDVTTAAIVNSTGLPFAWFRRIVLPTPTASIDFAATYGGVIILNIALWNDAIFGDFGTAGRAYWNPFINSFLQWFGTPLKGLPAWPLYETVIGTLLFFGAIYYLVSVRGRAADVEADVVTGEATIG
jgi:hypothetical protein